MCSVRLLCQIMASWSMVDFGIARFSSGRRSSMEIPKARTPLYENGRHETLLEETTCETDKTDRQTTKDDAFGKIHHDGALSLSPSSRGMLVRRRSALGNIISS